MRLDKYLKVSRLIKRRTVANEVCDAKHVTVNGKIARASYDVKVGDVIENDLQFLFCLCCHILISFWLVIVILSLNGLVSS